MIKCRRDLFIYSQYCTINILFIFFIYLLFVPDSGCPCLCFGHHDHRSMCSIWKCKVRILLWLSLPHSISFSPVTSIFCPPKCLILSPNLKHSWTSVWMIHGSNTVAHLKLSPLLCSMFDAIKHYTLQYPRVSCTQQHWKLLAFFKIQTVFMEWYSQAVIIQI